MHNNRRSYPPFHLHQSDHFESESRPNSVKFELIKAVAANGRGALGWD